MSGKRSKSAESGLLAKAVDITGKNCQKKKIGHNRIARYSALFCETKYQADPVAAKNAADSADDEDERDQNARSQFHFSALAAQAVEEHAPAQVGDGGELGGNFWTRHFGWINSRIGALVSLPRALRPESKTVSA